ncbi:MAG: hypothetical protein HY999_04960, partial [Nitrospinae bacterium]|nr:hypothetical protein [Nitrospinota bacterium]
IESYNDAKKLIEENKDKLYKLAEALLEKEVIDAAEIDEIIFGKVRKVKRRKRWIDKEQVDNKEKNEVELKDKVESDKIGAKGEMKLKEEII